MREPWKGFPYEVENDRSGARIGHLIFGVIGLVLGFLLGSIGEVATATMDALLGVAK